MGILHKLATSLNRRDEVPNQELAQEILLQRNGQAVAELVENLANKNRNIQSDCLKVLYEIGAREPSLIAGYCREFGRLLDSANNRLVWGAMTALDSIALNQPKGVHSLLKKILAAADAGSVITRDHAVGILVKLGSLKPYGAECVPLLLEQLTTCPDNQFPMYAEMSLAVVTDKNRKAFHRVFTTRLSRLEKESQKRRVSKALRRLTTK